VVTPLRFAEILFSFTAEAQRFANGTPAGDRNRGEADDQKGSTPCRKLMSAHSIASFFVALDPRYFAIQSNGMTAPQFTEDSHVPDGGGSDSVRWPGWASLFHRLRTLPVWVTVALWLAVLLSPTGCFLALMVADRLHVRALPEGFVITLFCLIPLVALLVCCTLVWTSKVTRSWRAAWMVLTILAWLLECALLFVIIVSAITAAISLP
jgi:hypothetical protein